ncbi:MAG: flavin reductase family protein [Clostridia bacterium]|nr:flavin reductase family protein [Clostridia bacterium]
MTEPNNNKICWKGGTLLAPVPAVMVSCGSMEKPNILTIGWTGILNTDPPKTYISVRPGRYSYPLIKESGSFVINLTTEALVRAADFCGVRSGRDVNKFEACHLTAAPSLTLPDTPSIAESPVSIECKVCDIVPLGTHDMFIADIVSVAVSPSLVDENGRLCLEKAALTAYAHGDYFALGRKLGDFGFSVRKKSTQKKRNAAKKSPRKGK